jgi:hypothetical protein
MWAVGVMLVLMACRDARGVVNGEFIPCDDRRFDAVGLFITVGGWGVECPGAVSGTCTLIDKDTVLIARHCIDGAGVGTLPDPATYRFRVRFRRSTTGEAANTHQVDGVYCHGVYQEFFIKRFIDILPANGTDQVLGILEHAPVGIRPIQVELNNPPRASTNVILAGWGYSGTCLGAGEHWGLRYSKGRSPDNMALTDYFVFSPCNLLSTGTCITCPPLLTQPYVLANLHDSGAPLLIEVPSTDPAYPQPELRLVGVVSSPGLARRPSAWNNAQGSPRLTQAPTSISAIKRMADFNCDNSVNLDDVMWFIGQYTNDTCLADLNHDHDVNIDDLFTYIGAYFRAPTE